MKYAIFSLLVGMLGLLGCQTPEPSPPSPLGSFTVRSAPEGAKVYLGKVLMGETPLEAEAPPIAFPVTIYAEGYVPRKIVAAPPHIIEVDLQPTSRYLYNILAHEKVRFTYRQSMDALFAEPMAHPVDVGSVFTYHDFLTNRDFLLTVKEIHPAYVLLESESGLQVYYPVLTLK